MAQSLLKLPNFPKEQSVEVIIILEDNSQTWSAETLAMERLPQLENPSQLITIIEANSEIDEDELKPTFRRYLSQLNCQLNWN
ncbi:MAG: hypothetical protein NDM07_05220, partial [Planktothrix agardhii LY1]|uniref:hypothetical protein n=1 Tax=Planktothrix agardhii TaxID=1160 RepID=UPI0024332161